MASFVVGDMLFDSYSARDSQTPCPDCGRVGTMTLSADWRVDSEHPIDYSLAGAQLKFSATLRVRITCGAEDVEGCGWNTTGEFEDGKFVVRELKRKEEE